MAHHPANRFVSFTESVAIVILTCYLCVHSLPRAWKSLITDFPNYYLTARIARDGLDTSRMYEWRWLEREKDHRGIDVPAVGIIPLTPFSTLLFWPLTGLAPLTAKHGWILLNLLLVVPIGWMLKSMTGLAYRRIGLIFALCFPYYRNLEYGQFYVFLLLTIVTACWMHLRGRQASAGAIVAIAASCKIFPLLLFVIFLQRRNWRALIWGAVTGMVTVLISIGILGVSVHRTYLFEILPWAMRGEAMPPYVINGSISGFLHALFLSEPQWNPKPWHPSVLAYALLLPALQMTVLAPAILMIRRDDSNREQILLEWSAVIAASLAVSTLPASYHFVLMIFPMCVLSAILLEQRKYIWLGVLLVAFVGIGFPMPHPPSASDLRLFLYVPRFPLTLAVLVGIYALLWPRSQKNASPGPDWTRFAWLSVMVTSVVLSSRSTFLRESAVRQEYPYRLPLVQQGLLNADPRADGEATGYIAFTVDGYRLIPDSQKANHINVPDSTTDVLSFYSSPGHLWLENVTHPRSTIADIRNGSQTVIIGGRNPMSSLDGETLAYIRDDRGQGTLMAHGEATSGSGADKALTPASLNVYEATFRSAREFAFAASDGRAGPELYLTDASHSNSPLGLAETRYPALSPDGIWLAYSQLDHGVWNLWVRYERTGDARRVSNVPCNQIEPSWQSDSKTVLYATDCGRSLWFTALARRQIIP